MRTAEASTNCQFEGEIKYNQPIKTHAYPPKQSQKSLRQKLKPIPLVASEEGNSTRVEDRERGVGCLGISVSYGKIPIPYGEIYFLWKNLYFLWGNLYSARFAAVLQNKLHVSCFPFYCSLSSLVILKIFFRGEAGGGVPWGRKGQSKHIFKRMIVDFEKEAYCGFARNFLAAMLVVKNKIISVVSSGK